MDANGAADCLGRRDGAVVLIGLGAGSYAGMLWAMRIKGREDIAAMWEKFRTKGR